MSDETYVRIKLRDLTIIDQFICYSEYRMEAEPTHRVLIHAKGDYDPRGDKLEIDGQQVGLDPIQIMGVSTKEDCLKSAAHQSHISIYMIDSVFATLVDLLRRGAETGEITMMLGARPWVGLPGCLRLTFDGMDMKRKVGATTGDQTLPAGAPAHHPDHALCHGGDDGRFAAPLPIQVAVTTLGRAEEHDLSDVLWLLTRRVGRRGRRPVAQQRATGEAGITAGRFVARQAPPQLGQRTATMRPSSPNSTRPMRAGRGGGGERISDSRHRPRDSDGAGRL